MGCLWTDRQTDGQSHNIIAQWAYKNIAHNNCALPVGTPERQSVSTFLILNGLIFKFTEVTKVKFSFRSIIQKVRAINLKLGTDTCLGLARCLFILWLLGSILGSLSANKLKLPRWAYYALLCGAIFLHMVNDAVPIMYSILQV